MPEQEDFAMSVLSEFNTKLRDIEEKQRLLKERTLLIGQNLVESKDEQGNSIAQLKSDVETMKTDIKKMKSMLLALVEEVDKRARKSELELLSQQAKMFQPLELVRMEDLKKILKR